jgi:hypothetical protein
MSLGRLHRQGWLWSALRWGGVHLKINEKPMRGRRRTFPDVNEKLLPGLVRVLEAVPK